MKVIVDLQEKPLECEASHHFECPCIFGVNNQIKRKHFFSIIEEWQDSLETVAQMIEFNDREVCINTTKLNICKTY